MKTETVIKVLRRYAKSLQVMELESLNGGDAIAAEHYGFDKKVMEEAISKLERKE